MAAQRVMWAVLVAALISVALCQDGLTCTNVGETWRNQCNTCSCRDGVTVCTEDRCSTDRSTITSGSCLAGSKWQDSCGNTCLCDPSGKRRCTVGSCPARVRSDRSMTFIRTTGDACAAGDTWTVDCHSCSCVGGKAVCSTEDCPRRPPQAPETCEPDEQWEDECGNLCECTEDGVAACTMLACAAGQRAGARRRTIRRSGDECSNEGEHWEQDCNECDCNRGVVSCAHRLCAQWQRPDTYGKCQANTRWVDECDNLCYCTERGVPSCTLKECPYGRKEGVRSHFLLEDGSSCSNEGEQWQQGCSRCRCSAGRVACTHRGCQEVAARAATPEPDWLRCQGDTNWEDECGNICSCWNGGPLCTRMGCPKGRTAGKPVKFITFDGDVCKNEGDSWKDECNSCSCTDGVVVCTKKFCHKQRQSVRFLSPFMAMTCIPGQRWIDECDNTCFCPDTGHSACTMMACPPGKRPMVPVRYIHADGDTCSDEGSSWRHECNTCRCSDGRVTCTKRPCRQLLRGPLLTAGAGPGSDKQCEEATEWTDECANHCRCAPGGLTMCTIQVCAPGKQAGRPLRLRPKLGEPCENGEETWLDDCNTCQCVDGVTACTRVTCRPQEQERDGVPVQQCRPDSSWLDECDNHCSCSERGLSYCTLKACPHGKQYGVPKKFVLSVNDTCADEGATWRQDCNACSCTAGRVNCTEQSCVPVAGVAARFGRRGSSCVTGSKWTDQCENTCRCTSFGQPACSLKPCAPGKKAGVAVEALPAAGDACDTEGSTWKEDCSRCTCTDGVVLCTEQICTSLELPTKDEGPCTEGEEWIDECTNRCKCTSGDARCTRRPCPQGGRAGVPVRFVVPDGDECNNNGEQWQDDCNTCRCDDGRVQCTKKACVGLERGGGNKKPGNCPFVPPGTLGICFNGCNGDDMCEGDDKCCSNGCGAMCMKPDSCLEGIDWEDDCNSCVCRNGETTCTNKICARDDIQFDQPAPPASPESVDEPECLEGSVWKKDCNTCDCIHGKQVCTRKLCPSNISPIDEVTGECREDSVWRKGCNRCRCINGRAVCTMKQCDTEANKKPGHDDALCRMPPVDLAKEECAAYIRRWTFDFAKGKCRRYVYGGCHGTQNLFRTRKQCRKRCQPEAAQSSRAAACRLPVEIGPCFDIIPRYFFDTAADKCRQFGFSGCGGNSNNFHALAACIGACGGTYTSEDRQCDRRNCPWSLYKHYTDQGCEPVYENQACCPTKFDCPEIRQSGPEKCKYHGRQYSNGDPVLEASKLDPCKRDCQCISTPEEGARIDCAEVDCPASVWNQISAGCLPLYLPHRCCPVSVKCPSRRRRRSAELSLPSSAVTCQADGRTYVEGEMVPVRDDPCLTCVCTAQYDGPNGTTCRRTECLHLAGGRMTRGCVPVYKTGVCCPVDWKCPEDMSYRTLPLDSQLPANNPVERFCSLPKKTGPCLEASDRYFFDMEQRKCVQFVYGGCQGNDNNFLSHEECHAACNKQQSAAGSSGQTMGAGSEQMCVFGKQTVPRGTWLDVQDKCTVCECLAPPKLTCRKLYCPQMPPGLEGLCQYRQRDPEACCPELVCDAAAEVLPNPSPECAGEQCPPPATRPGCSVVYRPGECCPRLECLHPPPQQHSQGGDQCEQVECASGCLVTRDQYGCVQCDCSGDVVVSWLRASPLRPVCDRQFCPVGCPSHYEYGCIVCECRTRRMAPAPPPTPRPPCVSVTCWPGCGYKQDANGCTVCDCPPSTTPTPRTTTPVTTRPPCASVTCWPGCGYKQDANGCTVCDCLPPTTPLTRPPCVSVTCWPGCVYKQDANGCTVCDCPPSTTPTPRTTTPTTTRPPCVSVTCRPGCGYKQNANGCTVCDCPPPTTPLTRPPCVSVTCRPGCGYKQNANGCTVCDCPDREYSWPFWE